MCSPGDVYRIHRGSEIAHWKNLLVGHQACFHRAGSHSVRLAAPDELRVRLTERFQGVCVCVRLLHRLGGPGRGLTGGDGLTAGAASRAKGPGAPLATCPSGAGRFGLRWRGGGSSRGLGGGQWKAVTRCEQRGWSGSAERCAEPRAEAGAHGQGRGPGRAGGRLRAALRPRPTPTSAKGEPANGAGRRAAAARSAGQRGGRGGAAGTPCTVPGHPAPLGPGAVPGGDCPEDFCGAF